MHCCFGLFAQDVVAETCSICLCGELRDSVSQSSEYWSRPLAPRLRCCMHTECLPEYTHPPLMLLHMCPWTCHELQWWIQMFLFPLDPLRGHLSSHNLVLPSEPEEAETKDGPTQLTVALMKDSSEAPGDQEVNGFTVRDRVNNNRLSGTDGHWSRTL